MKAGFHWLPVGQAGLQVHLCQDNFADAHFALTGPWVMSGTAFFTVRLFWWPLAELCMHMAL